ncbi:MAG: rod shape-determining protein MreC [Clostridia bacterium]|nr:rod shape-determining protein MreC [Clostridia bacterium]
MKRFYKRAGFRIFAVVIAALLLGSVISVASRSGSSPLVKVTGIVFGPASRVASAVTNNIKKIPVTFRSSSYLKRENKALRSEIDSLREQLVDYEEVVYKNNFYKEFLELKEEHEDYKFAEAPVIGRDSADKFGTLTLGRGSTHGIKVNDPVIYGKYLVGVVASVTPTQCVVNTLMNPSVNVSAYESRTREVSYVTTTAQLAKEGHCSFTNLSAGTAVTDGGIVCTAGVGGIYPSDLIIGTVIDIVDATLDISASAIIEPGVDFSQLTDVFILTSFNGQAN